ncbi:MAG: RadC family protein [bacterium JZ-2024 1]
MNEEAKKRAIFYDWKNLKERHPDERPREKMEKYGASALTESELLGLLISAGYRGKTAVELARDLLEKFGGLRGLRETPLEVLKKEKGMGLPKASRILAAVELAARMIQEKEKEAPKRMLQAEAVFHYLQPLIGHLPYEEFHVLLLSSKLELVKQTMISRGAITQTIAEPNLAYRDAIRFGVPAVIFAHNHPSGDPTPSEEDKLLTKRLKEVGDLLQIRMLDHIIVCHSRYFSFAEQGKL